MCISVPLQNKENCGLVERLTSLASTHSHTVDRLQGVEAQLEKSTRQRASLEARERTVKEGATLVSLEVNPKIFIQLFVSFDLFCFCLLMKQTVQYRILILALDDCTASKGDRCPNP